MNTDKSERTKRREINKYWVEAREKASRIRDAYERPGENLFHYKIYRNVRPVFMEPLPNKLKRN